VAEALADLQRWMLGALDHPGPAGAGAGVGAVLAPSPTMTAAACLDVYRRGYRQRLLECMREMHPGLVHLAGQELFDAFALDYLAAHPPAGYTLSRLADGFADHLDAACPEAERGPWTDLVVDVARFERAFLAVYDGPGTEGSAPVWTAGTGGLRVTPAPCLHLLRSRFPAGAYVCAVRRGEQPPMPTPEPTFEALVRRDYVVERVPLGAGAYAALEALVAGAGPDEAARAGSVTESDVVGWVTEWAERGLFSQISVPGREARCS
jgi:hypothetical protein